MNGVLTTKKASIYSIDWALFFLEIALSLPPARHTLPESAALVQIHGS